MISMRIFIAVLSFAALSGCAASGIKHADQLAMQPPVSNTASRITVFRTKESGQYSARSAPLSVDNRLATSIKYGGFSTLDLQSGQHILMTELSNLPGKCELPVQLNAGTIHYFEITPRLANFVSAVTGNVVGAALESAGKTCGGAFSIFPVTEEIALFKLRDLRKSD